MKTIKNTRMAGWLAFVVLVLFSMYSVNAQPGATVSFRTFYEELSPYGEWVTHPSHGSVWIPDAGPGFQPYGTNGYWVMTEFGNTWVSDYAWGWAPFHYGRWFYDDYYGWAWVPGHEWGPAWVAWRSGRGHYGWAPLGPGMNIYVNWDIPTNYWVFVPHRYFTSVHPYRYCVARPQVVHVYHNTVYIHNTYERNRQVYVCGPRRDEIRRVTRRDVTVYRIEEVNRPGRSVARNGSVALYRPRITPDRQEVRPSRSAGYSRAPVSGNNAPSDNRQASRSARFSAQTETRRQIEETRRGEVNQRTMPAARTTSRESTTDRSRGMVESSLENRSNAGNYRPQRNYAPQAGSQPGGRTAYPAASAPAARENRRPAESSSTQPDLQRERSSRYSQSRPQRSSSAESSRQPAAGNAGSSRGRRE